jgi:hypothetical protein
VTSTATTNIVVTTGRVPETFVVTTTFTTSVPDQTNTAKNTASAGNNTTAGNTSNNTTASIPAGNPNSNTVSTTSTSTSKTPTSSLPLAPTDNVDGGGNPDTGAPKPGQKSSDGRFGPNDDYISAALALAQRAAGAVVTITSVVVGTMLVWA